MAKLASGLAARGLIAALIWPQIAVAWADEDTDADANIVVGCHFSTGEFGYEAIDICVKENRAARAEVLKYPAEVRQIVERCTRRWEPGWVMVKRCVDEDLAAAPALEAYARDHGPKVDGCRDRFGDRGEARVRLCVEQAIETEDPREE
jgi:hypothetical protein